METKIKLFEYSDLNVSSEIEAQIRPEFDSLYDELRRGFKDDFYFRWLKIKLTKAL